MQIFGGMKYVKKWENLSVSRKLIMGFLIAIILGTVLLKLPFSLQENKNITFLEALFTTVSAVCVTGLSVVDISETFSNKGHFIILFFIQLGGLGVMTFSTMIFVIIGRKMSFNTRELLKEEINSENNGGVGDFIKLLLTTVFFIEIIGAIVLAYEFSKILPIKKAIFYGIFHSISAFCNAGFALFSNNLESFRTNIIVNLTISYLIILGGIGFTVINSILFTIKDRKNKFNLTAKISLKMGIYLIIIGMVMIFIFEYSNTKTIGELNLLEKIMTSFFQSVTLRTAGFNTIDLEGLRPATIFLSYILMFIGASPGSTGGGIKTTTFAIIIYYVKGILKSKEHTEIFNRRIDWEIMNKALAIIILSIAYISILTMLILTLEGFSIVEILYEVISAFATVGLSLNITSELGTISRLLIIFTMFLGRLGPLTIALAFTEQKKKSSLKYPKEEILVG